MKFIIYVIFPVLVVGFGLALVNFYQEGGIDWSLEVAIATYLVNIPTATAFFLVRYLFKRMPYKMWVELTLALAFIVIGVISWKYDELLTWEVYIFGVLVLMAIFKFIKKLISDISGPNKNELG